MTFPAVVGIDPSLTSTGVALWTPGAPVSISRVKSSPGPTMPGAKTPSWRDRHRRIKDAGARVAAEVPFGSLVVLEAPAYAAKSTSIHDRAGLWWEIYDNVVDLNCEVLIVTTNQRMKYSTGRGSADKDTVLAATIRRYLDIEIRNNDEADAMIFLAIGCRMIGHPLEDSLPKTHLDALAKLTLPDGVKERVA